MKKQKFAKIQEVLTEMAESGGAAGGNCLIFRHGEECCYYEAGYADLEKRIPIKRDTIFRLYSMTKPMTAVGAMLLVQDGKLDLLAPVSRFFRPLEIRRSVKTVSFGLPYGKFRSVIF